MSDKGRNISHCNLSLLGEIANNPDLVKLFKFPKSHYTLNLATQMDDIRILDMTSLAELVQNNTRRSKGDMPKVTQ